MTKCTIIVELNNVRLKWENHQLQIFSKNMNCTLTKEKITTTTNIFPTRWGWLHESGNAIESYHVFGPKINHLPLNHS